MVAVTRLDVKTNAEDNKPTTGVSTQEEWDKLIILHAAEISAAGKHVHIMSQDTDVLVLALRRFSVGNLDSNTTMVMGTHDKRRKIPHKPIQVLGSPKQQPIHKMPLRHFVKQHHLNLIHELNLALETNHQLMFLDVRNFYVD